jgi:hypothetical protein
MATRHAPVERELLFVFGYPGQYARVPFNVMFAGGCGYLCQEAPAICTPLATPPFDRLSGQAFFDPARHFAIEYRPGPATIAVGDRGLPLPPGMSGSLVWDTGYFAARADGREWSPEMAVITAIVWGWHSNTGHIVATRIDHMHGLIRNFCTYL